MWSSSGVQLQIKVDLIHEPAADERRDDLESCAQHGAGAGAATLGTIRRSSEEVDARSLPLCLSHGWFHETNDKSHGQWFRIYGVGLTTSVCRIGSPWACRSTIYNT
ncbi:hypothetical protein IG631_09883 [Alternaria alternata]|jgi:hypothetical protein|nr:hypothetical protein IG631_09883 [Alternaria alternata]